MLLPQRWPQQESTSPLFCVVAPCPFSGVGRRGRVALEETLPLQESVLSPPLVPFLCNARDGSVVRAIHRSSEGETLQLVHYPSLLRVSPGLRLPPSRSWSLQEIGKGRAVWGLTLRREELRVEGGPSSFNAPTANPSETSPSSRRLPVHCEEEDTVQLACVLHFTAEQVRLRLRVTNLDSRAPLSLAEPSFLPPKKLCDDAQAAEGSHGLLRGRAAVRGREVLRAVLCCAADQPAAVSCATRPAAPPGYLWEGESTEPSRPADEVEWSGGSAQLCLPPSSSWTMSREWRCSPFLLSLAHL